MVCTGSKFAAARIFENRNSAVPAGEIVKLTPLNVSWLGPEMKGETPDATGPFPVSTVRTTSAKF